ncbi:hypothetical protein GW846_05240 [Candidatus Gracilibacteria bacterium]|nr:hypothetical protein [Candidatus Gracilibacteria bacterium]
MTREISNFSEVSKGNENKRIFVAKDIISRIKVMKNFDTGGTNIQFSFQNESNTKLYSKTFLLSRHDGEVDCYESDDGGLVLMSRGKEVNISDKIPVLLDFPDWVFRSLSQEVVVSNTRESVSELIKVL